MHKANIRKEKNCLNCGYTIDRSFCSNCGQENLEAKEPFWQFLSHLIRLNLALDGKFAATLKTLFLKPGLISEEYMAGKRSSYIHPARMYIFISFLLFFLFFIFYNVKKTPIAGKTLSQIHNLTPNDFAAFTASLNDGKPMTRDEFTKYADSVLMRNINFTENNFRDRAQYDSLLAIGAIKHSWLKKQDTYKRLEINERFKYNPSAANIEIFQSVLHSIPRVIFFSLPLLALWLKLIYRKRKTFYYVSHGVFTVHFLTLCLISVLFIMFIHLTSVWVHLSWLNYFSILIGLAMMHYLYLAMRYFYKDKGWSGFWRYILFSFSLFLTLFILFSGFFISSFYSV